MKTNSLALIPKIRFPSYVNMWNVVQLNELLEESKSRNYESVYTKDDVLSVSGEKGVVNQISHMGRSYAGVSIDNYHILKRGEIVYTKSPLKRNPFGIIKMNKGNDGIVSTLYAVYKTKNSITSEFLDYYFQLDDHVNNYLRPLVKKGAKNDMKINNEYVLHDTISVPSLDEQHQIVLFLSSVDEWLNNLYSQKKLLEDYKNTIMQKIFSQDVRFKDKGNTDYPNWEEKYLGDIATFLKGKGISKEDISIGGEYKCIRYGELYTIYNELIYDINSRTNILPKDSFLSKSNDLLIPSSGETAIDISKVSCIGQKDVLLGSDLNVIRLDKEYSGRFFAYYLSYWHRRDIAKLAQGNAVVHLYASQLKKLRVKIPSYYEQNKIGDILSSIDALIELKKNQIKGSEIWKKGLMQSMFA